MTTPTLVNLKLQRCTRPLLRGKCMQASSTLKDAAPRDIGENQRMHMLSLGEAADDRLCTALLRLPACLGHRTPTLPRQLVHEPRKCKSYSSHTGAAERIEVISQCKSACRPTTSYSAYPMDDTTNSLQYRKAGPCLSHNLRFAHLILYVQHQGCAFQPPN
jgi:hypothetical protein